MLLRQLRPTVFRSASTVFFCNVTHYTQSSAGIQDREKMPSLYAAELPSRLSGVCLLLLSVDTAPFFK